jgi:hypothetical protein
VIGGVIAKEHHDHKKAEKKDQVSGIW